LQIRGSSRRRHGLSRVVLGSPTQLSCVISASCHAGARGLAGRRESLGQQSLTVVWLHAYSPSHSRRSVGFGQADVPRTRNGELLPEGAVIRNPAASRGSLRRTLITCLTCSPRKSISAHRCRCLWHRLPRKARRGGGSWRGRRTPSRLPRAVLQRTGGVLSATQVRKVRPALTQGAPGLPSSILPRSQLHPGIRRTLQWALCRVRAPFFWRSHSTISYARSRSASVQLWAGLQVPAGNVRLTSTTQASLEPSAKSVHVYALGPCAGAKMAAHLRYCFSKHPHASGRQVASVGHGVAVLVGVQLELARVHGCICEVGVQPTHMHSCPLSIHVPVAFAELA